MNSDPHFIVVNHNDNDSIHHFPAGDYLHYLDGKAYPYPHGVAFGLAFEVVGDLSFIESLIMDVNVVQPVDTSIYLSIGGKDAPRDTWELIHDRSEYHICERNRIALNIFLNDCIEAL